MLDTVTRTLSQVYSDGEMIPVVQRENWMGSAGTAALYLIDIRPKLDAFERVDPQQRRHPIVPSTTRKPISIARRIDTVQPRAVNLCWACW